VKNAFLVKKAVCENRKRLLAYNKTIIFFMEKARFLRAFFVNLYTL